MYSCAAPAAAPPVGQRQKADSGESAAGCQLPLANPPHNISVHILHRGLQMFKPRGGLNRSEAFQVSCNRRTGVMYVNDSPLAVFPVIDLRFSALRVNRRSVCLDSCHEIPVELRPCSLAINIHRNVFGSELPFRERGAHQVSINVSFDLCAAMFLAPWMDKRDLRRVRPNLVGEGSIGAVDGEGIGRDQVQNTVNVSVTPGTRGTAGKGKRKCDTIEPQQVC